MTRRFIPANDGRYKQGALIHDHARPGPTVAGCICSSANRLIMMCSLIEPNFIRPLPGLVRSAWKTRSLAYLRRRP